MTGLSDSQREVAHRLFGLSESEGLALAGGSALIALGVIDRTTRDAFFAARPGKSPGDLGPLASAFVADLGESGWTVEVLRGHQTFTRMIARKGGESIEVDLAVDSPPLFPVEVVDRISCLAPQDMAARKVLAILDRAEGRDFTDLWVLSREYGKAETISWAKQLDGGVEEAHVAGAFGDLDRLGDDELPCDPSDRVRVRQWFETWRAELGSTTSE